MLRRVALVRTYVSEEPSASFIRATRIGELGTTQAATSNRRNLRRNTKWAARRNIPKDTILRISMLQLLPHGVSSQKTAFLIVTAVKTWNITSLHKLLSWNLSDYSNSNVTSAFNTQWVDIEYAPKVATDDMTCCFLWKINRVYLFLKLNLCKLHFISSVSMKFPFKLKRWVILLFWRAMSCQKLNPLPAQHNWWGRS
jgi:hypothetical protein